MSRRGPNEFLDLAVHADRSRAGALGGMACVFTAAFNAPVTGMIMIFELTQDYGSLPVLMVATVIASLAARPVHRVSSVAVKKTIDKN